MKHRRLAGAIAVASAVAVVTAGCASTEGTSGADGELSGKVTMWTYPIILDERGGEQAFWDTKAEEFAELHPDVDVEVIVQPWSDREANITTAIAGGVAPDVVYMITDQIAQFEQQGVLEPAESYLAEANLTGMLPNAREGVSVDGVQMAAPLLMQVNPLSCNKAVFDELGLDFPETYSDVLELGPALKDAGYYAYNYDGSLEGGSAASTFYPVLRSFGGAVFTEDGTDIAFDSPEGVAALQWIKDIVDAGFSNPDAVVQSIPSDQGPGARGEIACRNDTTPQDFATQIGEENVAVLPPLADVEQVAAGTVGSFVLLSGSKNKTAAGEWVSFITSQENTAEYGKLAGFNTPYGDDIFAGEDPLMEATSALLEYAYFGDVNPSARKVSGVILPEIQAALLGTKTPEQALDDAAAAARQVMVQ